MTEAFEQFHLMRPEWLWAALPAIILGIMLWRARSRSGGWSEVIAPELLPYLVGKGVASRGPNLLPFILVAWLLAALAAAGPSWTKIPQPIHQKQDAMVLVLDLSYSMKAGDLAPSRLDRARQKLLDLLEQRNEGQTGLIAYAGDSHIVTPLTDDNPTIANLLPVLSPDMMPMPGSNTAAAIRQAVELMHSAGISQGQIVLITDGVDSDAREDVIDILRGSGMQLSILGVGTAAGAPIPLARGGFLKDSSGTIVIPKYDASELRSLASATSGRYLNIQLDDSDLEQLLSAPLLSSQTQTLALDRTADTWDDQGYLLVLLLIPLVLPLFRRGWMISLLPLVLMGSPDKAHAQLWDNLWYTPDQQGQRALESGNTEEAFELFESPEWAGTAAYQGEDYESAASRFAEGDSSDHWYNRGNALAKGGQIEEAIDAYKKSLERQPDQVDAQENLALLEQLKDQQDQQQQQQDGEGEDKQDQQDQDQSGQQNQSDQQNNEDSPEQPQDGEQDDQQPPSDQQQGQEPPPDSGDNGDPSEEEESDKQPPEQPEAEDEQQASEQEQQANQAQAEEASPEDEEKDQAMQQWLRRVPDDPSGLLREKFRYESRQRQQQGDVREDETYW